jgi:acetyl esterase
MLPARILLPRLLITLLRRLPSWLLRRFGRPPVNRRGHSLDPMAWLFVRLASRVTRAPSLEHLAQNRQTFAALAPVLGTSASSTVRRQDLSCPGPAGPIPLRLYSARPAGAPPSPLLLYFHGGGFVQGNLESHDRVCARLADRTQALVLSVDYRLAPEHPFPAAVLDALCAWRWLAANTATLGADPARLAVGGDSAGATLSAIVAAETLTEPVRPSFQLLVYPFVDARLTLPSVQEFGVGYFLEKSSLEFYLDCYAPDRSTRLQPRISPLLAPSLAHHPPAAVIVAGFDPLRDEGEAYAQRLEDAGIPVTFRSFDQQLHGFFNLGGILSAGNTAIDWAADQLKQAWK